MEILVLDFESHFSDDYTLKKLTTEAYCRDPRFELHGVGLYWPNRPERQWVERDNVAEAFSRIDWGNTSVLCHHAHFDCLILSHHFGVVPGVIFDTLAMGRGWLGNHVSAALDSITEFYGLPSKNVPYEKFKGKRWHELGAGTQQELGDGCIHDCVLTWQIFKRFMQEGFPPAELEVIDLTVRMFTEPQLTGDIPLLAEVWADEEVRKRDLMAAIGADSKALQSNDSFTALLAAEGVEVEMKPGKNGLIPAFAKTDDFMKNLLEDTDDRVRELAEARLGLKSTLDQTRSERLGDMACRGALLIYLSYCGAHTSRWSGGDSMNFQNFKRGSKLRRALCAPKGHKIVKADKSQVEARILATVAGQWDLVERFRNGEDPYVDIASKFYGEPVYKPAKDDPRKAELEAKRGMGKQLILSCGFGAGAVSIQKTAARGTYGPPVVIDLDEAYRARDLYRGTNPRIPETWAYGDWVLRQLADGNRADWGPCAVVDGQIWLPSGLSLKYPQLHWANVWPSTGTPMEKPAWVYKTRKDWKKVWGGFITENLIQALSATDMRESMLRIKAAGYRLVLTEHDAGAWLCEERDVDNCVKVVDTAMTQTPTWLPALPLACETTVSDRYS